MASTTETTPVPSFALVSVIVAALKLINFNIGSLPLNELRTIVLQLQATNAVVSHSIRGATSGNPTAHGSLEAMAALYRLERDAREVDDLSVFLECMSTEGRSITPVIIFSF